MAKGNGALLCQLMANRGELLRQLQDMVEATAWTRPEPEEWSTMEVLLHLADVDLLMVRRFGEILAGKEVMTGYSIADWEASRKAAERDGIAGVLLRLNAARQEVLQTVSGLSEADLERSSRHVKYGPMTSLGLVEMELRHDLDHAQQIAKTRAVVEK